MTLAIIGGTGIGRLEGVDTRPAGSQDTPWGPASACPALGQLGGLEVLFMPRHGVQHQIPPHLINYRANIWALREAGASDIITINAVGGIGDDIEPSSVVLPHDLIDYTWGRESSYAAPGDVIHVEFATPYSSRLRTELIDAADAADVPFIGLGVHAVTQGPRLETMAEIRRLARDGCTIVGMTGMPEAVLARELKIDLACLAVIVNWAAGFGDGGDSIHAEIEEHLARGMGHARSILEMLGQRRAQGVGGDEAG